MARAVRGGRLGNERLAKIPIELPAEVRRQAVDVAAQVEHGVTGGLPRECSDRGANRLRLGPAPLPRECFEAFEILVFKVDLQRLCS